MFHISLVFIIFPIAGVISGSTRLTLLWTLLFVLAFYSVLVSQNRTVQWLAWWIMLAYIFFYSSVWLNVGFAWFIFYLSNLLVYQLDGIFFTLGVLSVLLSCNP